MFPIIPPTPFFQPSNCEVLIGIIEPLCASWIIREKEEEKERTQESDDSLQRVSIGYEFEEQGENTSMMNSHLKPSRPPAPLICPTPYAIAPPNAPARLQKAMTSAIRTARSLYLYQIVMK
jgi:hypothetical protein